MSLVELSGGALYGTMLDYVRFMRVFLNGGVANGNRILRADTVDLMSKNAMGPVKAVKLETDVPDLSNPAEFFPGMPKSWGLGFMINDQTAPTGRSAGSLAWAGLANSFFWIDQTKGVAARTSRKCCRSSM